MTRTSVADVPEPEESDPIRRELLRRLNALLNQKRVQRPRPQRIFDKPSEPHKDDL